MLNEELREDCALRTPETSRGWWRNDLPLLATAHFDDQGTSLHIIMKILL